ncbi:uncharacterized protein [Oscarella lobularis]|uniref:uncharacterized protein n=1 Tax=Oscarella lobularis TaxID=121494 RepID=UPI0033133520
MNEFYDLEAIICREAFFGEGYGSVGGEEASKILAGYLRPRKDGGHLNVLDVGAGLGGFSFFIARIDEPMVKLAQNRLASSDVAEKVKLQVCNVETAEFPAESFDAMVWRASLVHIPVSKKESVLKRTMKWLKPGGQFISMDLCLANRAEDLQGFQEYLDFMGIECVDIESYKKMLEAVGLKEIFAKEDNAFYLRKTVEELASAEKAKSEVKKCVSERTYQTQAEYWLNKSKWVEAGAICNAYFVAHK